MAPSSLFCSERFPQDRLNFEYPVFVFTLSNVAHESGKCSPMNPVYLAWRAKLIVERAARGILNLLSQYVVWESSRIWMCLKSRRAANLLVTRWVVVIMSNNIIRLVAVADRAKEELVT